MFSPEHMEKFRTAQEVDLAYSVAGMGRFRCNVFQQRGTVGLVLRVIPTRIKNIDELGLPRCSKRIAAEERGLVLVTGTTGSGKSTTLAAMIDYINTTRAAHIMTVEDPIEYLHRDHHSLVNQREVAVDTKSFAARAAQRAASGSRRDPGRRNARLRDRRDGAARGRDGAPGVLDAAHARRDRDDQPDHHGVPAAPAAADPHPARVAC